MITYLYVYVIVNHFFFVIQIDSFINNKVSKE